MAGGGKARSRSNLGKTERSRLLRWKSQDGPSVRSLSFSSPFDWRSGPERFKLYHGEVAGGCWVGHMHTANCPAVFSPQLSMHGAPPPPPPPRAPPPPPACVSISCQETSDSGSQCASRLILSWARGSWVCPKRLSSRATFLVPQSWSAARSSVTSPRTWSWRRARVPKLSLKCVVALCLATFYTRRHSPLWRWQYRLTDAGAASIDVERSAANSGDGPRDSGSIVFHADVTRAAALAATETPRTARRRAWRPRYRITARKFEVPELMEVFFGRVGKLVYVSSSAASLFRYMQSFMHLRVCSRRDCFVVQLHPLFVAVHRRNTMGVCVSVCDVLLCQHPDLVLEPRKRLQRGRKPQGVLG